VVAKVSRPNIESNIDIAKLPTFGEMSKVLGFLTTYRLYIRIKMRDTAVENWWIYRRKM